jgi:hypothetical protein
MSKAAPHYQSKFSKQINQRQTTDWAFFGQLVQFFENFLGIVAIKTPSLIAPPHYIVTFAPWQQRFLPPHLIDDIHDNVYCADIKVQLRWRNSIKDENIIILLKKNCLKDLSSF